MVTHFLVGVTWIKVKFVCSFARTLHNHVRLTGAPIGFSTHLCLVKPFPHLNDLLHFYKGRIIEQ